MSTSRSIIYRNKHLLYVKECEFDKRSTSRRLVHGWSSLSLSLSMFLSWNEVLFKITQENLGVKPAEEVPAWRRPRSRPGTCWKVWIWKWAQEHLQISQEELECVSGNKREAWADHTHVRGSECYLSVRCWSVLLWHVTLALGCGVICRSGGRVIYSVRSSSFHTRAEWLLKMKQRTFQRRGNTGRLVLNTGPFCSEHRKGTW